MLFDDGEDELFFNSLTSLLSYEIYELDFFTLPYGETLEDFLLTGSDCFCSSNSRSLKGSLAVPAVFTLPSAVFVRKKER